MHLQSQNYVEAALTLKLHSDLHEWNLTSFVEPLEDLGLPRQTQFQRKETICLLILDYLGLCFHVVLKSSLMSFPRQRESVGKCNRDLQGVGLSTLRTDI